MPLDESTFHLARKLNPAAIESLLASFCPAVHRIAHGLTGRSEVGNGVVLFIVRQAIRHLPTWRDCDAAERWFYHHTVLACRRVSPRQPPAKGDSLITPGGDDAPYVAFIRALRSLPYQQREAFLLHHAEQLPPRTLAVAMDCSTHAAQLHLQGAQGVLEPLAGPAFNTLTDRMRQVYQQLAPSEQVLRPALRRQIRRSLIPRRLKRLLTLALVLIFLGAAAYLAYHIGWLNTLLHR